MSEIQTVYQTGSNQVQTGVLPEEKSGAQEVADSSKTTDAPAKTSNPKDKKLPVPKRFQKPDGPVRDNFRLVMASDFSRSMIAGLPNDGFTFESLSPQDNPNYGSNPQYYGNRYTLRAGGLVTGTSDWQFNPFLLTPATDYSVGLEYSRMQRIEDPHREIYKSVGPKVSLTYNTAERKMTDRGVGVTMDTTQLQGVFGNATQDAIDLLDTQLPAMTGYDDQALIAYGFALQDWLNRNMSGLRSWPYVFRTMFNDYDLSQDVSTYVYASPEYPVRSHELKGAIWLGSEFRDYSVPVNFLTSAHLGIEAALLHFEGKHFKVNDYLGFGARFESSLLSLNLGKPVDNWLPPNLDLQVRAGLDFYQGIDDGLSDKSFMAAVNIGVGLKLSIPPPKKEWVEKFGRDTATVVNNLSRGDWNTVGESVKIGDLSF